MRRALVLSVFLVSGCHQASAPPAADAPGPNPVKARKEMSQLLSKADALTASISTPPDAAPEPAPSPEREVVTLVVDGAPYEVTKRRVTIGRSRECDIRLADPNASRRHAELRQDGATYWIVDLDSTNGVEVHGKRMKRLKLEDGSAFTVGSTELTFNGELQ